MSDHHMSDSQKRESGSSDGEQSGFRNSLFVNPISFDPDLQIHEIQEGVEGMNIFSDSFFSGRTPKSNDNSLTYKNCLSSDLLQKIEEGSPIKSSRTMRVDRKTSEMNLGNADFDEDEERANTHSLFYNKSNIVCSKSKKCMPEYDEDYAQGNFSKDKSYLTHEDMYRYFQNAQNVPFSPQMFAQRESARNANLNANPNPECSFQQGSKLSGSPNMPNMSYEEFLRKKCNASYGPQAEDFDQYSTAQSSISKKLSPTFNDEVSFFPKNFYSNNVIGNPTPTKTFNVPLNYNMRNANMNTNMNYHSNPNPTHTQIHSNSPIMNTTNAEYLRNPLSLNLNINKIKKNANITGLVEGGNATVTTPQSEKNFIPDHQPQKAAQQQTKNYQGKTGWVCSLCKNFNYESKNNVNNSYLVRVKCNRCGKPQSKNTNQAKNVSPNVTNTNNANNAINNMSNVNNNVPNLNANKLLYHSNGNINSTNKTPRIVNEVQQPTKTSYVAEHSNASTGTMNPNENVNKSSSTSDNSPTQPSLSKSDESKASSADSKKKKKPFVERVGDWVCIKCKNLNFSFRVVCNRCQLTKAESEKLFEQYMKNLMNYVKINELLQNQIITNQNLNMINQSQMHQGGGKQSNMGSDANNNLNNAITFSPNTNYSNSGNQGNKHYNIPRSRTSLGNLFSTPKLDTIEGASALYEVGNYYFNEESLSERLGNNNSK